MKTIFTLLASLALCSCAAMPEEQRYVANILATTCEAIVPGPVPTEDGLTWKKVNGITHQRTICWEQVIAPDSFEAHKQLTARCGLAWNGNACVMARLSNGTCWVLSTVPMYVAKVQGVHTPTSHVTGRSSVTLYQHEVHGHCAGRDHDEVNVLPVTWRK